MNHPISKTEFSKIMANPECVRIISRDPILSEVILTIKGFAGEDTMYEAYRHIYKVRLMKDMIELAKTADRT